MEIVYLLWALVCSVAAYVFAKRYSKLKKAHGGLEKKLEAIKKSDKYIEITQTVEIKGLDKLKKPLYLEGDYMLVNANLTFPGKAKHYVSFFNTNESMISLHGKLDSVLTDNKTNHIESIN